MLNSHPYLLLQLNAKGIKQIINLKLKTMKKIFVLAILATVILSSCSMYKTRYRPLKDPMWCSTKHLK